MALRVRPLDENTWSDFARLEDVDGRSVSASFLHNGTVAMFESQGFEQTRRLGKHHWVVTKVVR
jgi:hypothetical protein